MRHLLAFVLVVAAAGIAAAPAGAATTTERVPVDITAAGCGELVHLTGTVLVTTTVTPNGSGGFLLAFHANPQGVTGTGLTSGAVYHGTGVTRETTTVNGASTDTFVNSFKLIGPGSTPNYLETDIFHVTIDANGNVTSTVASSTIKCQP
jgi:hypothetical protein